MAFVAVLPTAGTALAGLGGIASSIPVIGGTLGAGLGGLGSAAAALGSIPTAGLGAGLSGAASSLGSGLLGMGTNAYLGADKLLGGFLPNIGGVGITPSQGLFGMMMPNAVGNNPMFGGDAFNNPNLTLEEAAMRNAGAGAGGLFGALPGMVSRGKGLMDLLGTMRTNAASPAAIESTNNLRTAERERARPELMGNSKPGVTRNIYNNLGNGYMGGALGAVMPAGGTMYQETALPVTSTPATGNMSGGAAPSGADRSLGRAFQNL